MRQLLNRDSTPCQENPTPPPRPSPLCSFLKACMNHVDDTTRHYDTTRPTHTVGSTLEKNPPIKKAKTKSYLKKLNNQNQIKNPPIRQTVAPLPAMRTRTLPTPTSGFHLPSFFTPGRLPEPCGRYPSPHTESSLTTPVGGASLLPPPSFLFVGLLIKIQAGMTAGPDTPPHSTGRVVLQRSLR